MKRRSFMKMLAGAAASVMVPLQLTVFGNDDELLLALDAPVQPNITWQSWEEIGPGYVNMDAVRKLELYRTKEKEDGRSKS